MHRSFLFIVASLAFACSLVAGPASVSAQPETLVEVEQFTEAVPSEVPEGDETVLNLSAGGALNTGNTQAFQVNTGGDFRLVRSKHAVGANTTFIFGRAKIKDEDGNRADDFEDTTRNLNARVRYDYFLTQHNALFVSGVYRWDTFAGLDARVQGQTGYLRNLYMQGEALRFWGEAGYDITYDNYTQEVLETQLENMEEVDEETIVHSARLFFGYDNHLTETFTIQVGLEGLLNMEDPEDFRLNWDSGVRSKINNTLQLEVKFMLKYDNQEVPGTIPLDTATQVNLVYALI